tara:strand:+ start:312 stop:755 length:444 start_codon:yes stop_codon:yes gene_type:complete
MIKDIEGFNYTISDTGEVANKKTGRILNPSKSSNGYLYVCLRKEGANKLYRLHRLLGIYFLGCTSDKVMDHIDGNKLNNALSNLRVVTQHQNTMNRHTAKGYSWHCPSKKWMAQIMLNGKNKNLGYFEKETDARAAYLAAKDVYHVI